MRYILFVKKECPFCVRAKELLEERGLEYKMVNFNQQQEGVLQEIKVAYDWKTVPMIFSRSKNVINFIGGFTDLVESLDKNNE